MQYFVEYLLLGKISEYVFSYMLLLLFFILCMVKWVEFGLSVEILFYCGVDIWNCYELFWLILVGKLVVVIGEFLILVDLLNIIELKLFKFYFNFFNQFVFDSCEVFCVVLQKDFLVVVGVFVGVCLCSFDEVVEEGIGCLLGCCIDELDIVVDGYEQLCLELLCCDVGWIVEEQFYSYLFKFNCLVIGQFDWGILVVDYQGLVLDLVSLLVYLVFFCQYQDFYEQCVECIFFDLQCLLQLQVFSVYVCYVCCGGLDINFYCSLVEVVLDN